MNNKIQELSKKIFAAENGSEKVSAKSFFEDYASREERHYCAYLFSWLLNSPDNIETFFDCHTNSENITNLLSDCDYAKCNLFYEYTGLRELIDLVGHNLSTKHLKEPLKEIIKKEVFGESKKNDIQKKKPDLAFYFPEAKLLSPRLNLKRVLIKYNFLKPYIMAKS